VCSASLELVNNSPNEKVDYQLELLSCRPSTQEFRRCLAQNPANELDDSPTISNSTY